MRSSKTLIKHDLYRVLRRWMGGPSSHLKQIKGLVRKAHQTLPLEHPKIQSAELERANRHLEAHLKAQDMEHIPPCDRGSCRETVDGLWCSVPVAYPPRHWPTVFNARGRSMRELEYNDSKKKRVRKYVLPEDVMIYQPGSRRRTEDGLEKLGLSMMDNVLAVDLQWNHPDSKVGLLQVASSTFALLIRGSKYWDRGLPEALVHLFQDPAVITLGFGFGSTDRAKLEESFGWTMDAFSNFIDVRKLTAKCGYPSDASLSTLLKKILDVRMHVEPDLDTVDWEAERLMPNASLYASLSVFAIGQIYRRLRHLHALPRRCSNCREELGIFHDRLMSCLDTSCRHTFDAVDQHRRHCLTTGHPYKSQLCTGCYRILPPEQQTRLDDAALHHLASHQLPNDDPVARSVARASSHLRRIAVRDRYKQRLISSGSQLTTVLYDDV